MNEAVIVSVARTALTKSFRGSFNDTEAPVLGGHVVRAVVERAGIEPGAVEDVIMGAAVQQGTQAYYIGRLCAYTGGLRFDVNASAAFGQRASGLEVRNAATGTWGPIDPAKTYRLFVLSFNATGGDGYKTLAAVPAARRLDIGVLDADVFQTWIDRIPEKDANGRSVIRKLPLELYSTQFFKMP